MKLNRIFTIVCLLCATMMIATSLGCASKPTATAAPVAAATTAAPAAATAEPTKSLMDTLAASVASEGGTLLTYGMPESWANYGAIYADIKTKYGITDQDIDLGSAVVYSRMTEENSSKNDIGDLIPSYAMKLANEGTTSDYKVSCWDSIPEGQKGVGKDGSTWVADYKGTIGWIVNTTIIKDVPKTWADLNKPEYKGLISYMDPRSTGTGMSTVEAVSYAVSGDPYNYKAGDEYLATLQKAGVIATIDPKVDVSKFQRGEIGILINFDYNLLQWKDTLGIPAEVVIPTDGTVSTAFAMVMAKNAPHPNTAKLFMEYAICGNGQALFAQAYVTPMNPNVTIPADLKAKFPPDSEYVKVMPIDYAKHDAIADAMKTDWAAAVGIQ